MQESSPSSEDNYTIGAKRLQCKCWFRLEERMFAVFFGVMLVSSVPIPGFGRSLDQDEAQQRIATEQVRFRHGKNLLAGILYKPAKPGPHAAIALVLGSGAQDRHYGGMGAALGNHFARRGFACLAWDKPGVGQSTGDFNLQTFRDRAEETLAAIEYLRTRTDINAGRVGLWGHSQGGMVAPLVASLSGKVAFLIDVSGWQGPAWQQDQTRVEAEMRADGISTKDINTAVAFAKARMQLIRGTEAFAALDKMQQVVKTEAWFEYVHLCDEPLFYSARRNVNDNSEPWWERVHCPVLVVFGDKDTSSGPPEPLVAIIRRGLAKAGNNDLTVKIFQGADHSLYKTQTGGRKEARQRIKNKTAEAVPDFVDGYLEALTGWLEKHVTRDRSQRH
jgi:pimeloyl-ACP methyl ester carboxylesterase